MPPTIDIDSLGFDAGAHLVVKLALGRVAVGEVLEVRGQGEGWQGPLAAWCRSQGHPVAFEDGGDGRPCARITRGAVQAGRWRGAAATGAIDPGADGAVRAEADARWGLAARGATVEAGSPAFAFRLTRREDVWADSAATLYAEAVAAQWNADTAIDWQAPCDLPDEVEDAVVQVMTYMVENENAALVVPARFLGQLHPHFREVQALLAIQVADEARHIDVFTRRIALKGRQPGLSTAGGQASLKTLVDEPDFSTAQFLLAVLGEGTFVSLLNFLHHHAPDPVTRQIARLAARDEARHVAFGMAHLGQHIALEPALLARLGNAVEARYEHLAGTSGLNEEVFDALILLAAGSSEPAAIAAGYARVQELLQDMARGREARLAKLGFQGESARRLASLHTRNFM
ncbi:ferritin-like domain-containing protein [Oryzomicrobium sp.]|uniref:ferritin-like domain-containing protein n=1 Tax=Oryzomicrobium sp. TaxID=1911578 RepID=UPI0025DFCB5A|nr:ferritin-like domain-containing protein [Oryzomicrobium sp.]MCE1244525.1 ferritin-like domain-containing protein [Oryzomicrobium sp.]